MNNEIWKDIYYIDNINNKLIDYIGLYQISNMGRIKSLGNGGRKSKLKILKIEETKKGYCRIRLSKNNISQKFSIHRLVAYMFIENISNKKNINHINGVKNDNRCENLEWCTSSENIIHMYKYLNPNIMKGGKSNKAIKVNQYDLNNNFIKTWDSIIDFAISNNLTHCYHISACIRNKRKTAYGYIWKKFEN